MESTTCHYVETYQYVTISYMSAAVLKRISLRRVHSFLNNDRTLRVTFVLHWTEYSSEALQPLKSQKEDVLLFISFNNHTQHFTHI